MYTLSCLQVVYEFLNREWMHLVYREEKKTWYRSLKSILDQWFFYILHSINFKNVNQLHPKRNYKWLTIILIISLGTLFAAYKVMQIFLSSKLKKAITEFQWWRNENSNKISPVFHENNNKSPQLTEDFTSGTSLTAVVKPTIRNDETWETIMAKDGHKNSTNKSASDVNSQARGFRRKIFGNMSLIENLDIIKPLVKRTSSLLVGTSKSSLNTELQTGVTEYETSQFEGNKGNMDMVNQVNNNLFAAYDSSSVSEIHDVISSVYEDTISHYECSMNVYPTPDSSALHKNSTYVSGHYVENFPDLDLSPIPIIPPKIGHYQQLLETDDINKEIEKVETKDTGRGFTYQEIPEIDLEFSHQTDSSDDKGGLSYQKYLDFCKGRSNDQKYLSTSIQSTPRSLHKSSDNFCTASDFRTNISNQKSSSHMNSKIPKLNLSADSDETNLKSSRLDTVNITGSKIPIPLKRPSPISISAEDKLNDSSRKFNSIEKEQQKESIPVNSLELKGSEQSLARFTQLEIATGCYNVSEFRHLQSHLSKS